MKHIINMNFTYVKASDILGLNTHKVSRLWKLEGSYYGKY